MKSENGSRQYDGKVTPTIHASHDDHVTQITHLFAFHRAAEIAKPSKQFISILANFLALDTHITGPGLSGYDYGKFNSHFKDLYKLLLFPFHGFW
ncbi:MAG: hypothetical protein JST32_02375 [Bacteroidetes bacterium]|nr:hypothetical protein [Bacteroidota bacterium]